MKHIFITILFFIFSITNLWAFSYSQSDLEIAGKDLISIKKGQTYKNTIDKFILKYEENEKILNILQSRIDKLKTKKLSKNSSILLDYLQIAVYISLDKLEENKKKLEEKERLETQKKLEEQQKEELVYPGFSKSYNDNQKTLLSGESYEIYKAKISSRYESVRLGKATFYLDGAGLNQFKNVFKSASLYVEGLLIETSSLSKVDIISNSKASISFENLEDVVIPEKSTELRLSLETNPIGYEKVGKSLKNIKVSSVSFEESFGLQSKKELNNFSVVDSGEEFSIFPATLELKKEKGLSDSSNSIKFDLVGLTGENTNTNGGELSMNLEKISFDISGNYSNLNYKISNIDDRSDFATGSLSGGKLIFDLSSLSSSNKNISSSGKESFELYIYGTGSVSISLARDGLIYSINGSNTLGNINLYRPENIYFGSRVFK